MPRRTSWLAFLCLLLTGTAGAVAGGIEEGARCGVTVGSSARPPTALLSRLALTREHGCSHSSETTHLMAEIRLELKGDTARLTIESMESLVGGPSPGRMRQGARGSFERSVRRRLVYTGATRLAAGQMIVELKTRESSEDLAGGSSFTGRKQEAVALELSCSPGAIGVGAARAGTGEQVACSSVWLCQGLRDLLPITHESLSQLAAGMLIDGAMPVAAAPGIELSASNPMGRPLRRYRKSASSSSSVSR